MDELFDNPDFRASFEAMCGEVPLDEEDALPFLYCTPDERDISGVLTLT
jgi:hypothetical protein